MDQSLVSQLFRRFRISFAGSRALATAFAFLSCAAAWASPVLKERCERVEGSLPWSWCFYETEGSTSSDLIFYFHGYGKAGEANEKLWTKADLFPAAVRERWAQQGVQAPKVFAVSFGATWGFAERESRGVAIPFPSIEPAIIAKARDLMGSSLGRVLVLGDSMGGFNASVFALRTSLPVAKLAALCPLLSSLSPFASFMEMQRFLRANPEANATKVALTAGFGRMLYADEAEWKAKHPLWLARGLRTPAPFAFYSSAGKRDQFGIFSGAAEFAQELRRAGTATEFEPLDQDHCAVDAAAAADFLAG